MAIHCEFLEYWNTQKISFEGFDNIFHVYLINMKEIEFWRWLFEGRQRQGKNVLPDGLNWLCCFVGNSKSHHENSISFIFLESPHQVDMKKRCQILQTHFWVWYFNTLQSHSELQMWKHFAIWCGKTWIKSQCHTFMTNDTSTLSSFPFLWNWAKSDLVKEMCVSCSLAWRNLWHDKRQKFWCYFAISIWSFKFFGF